MTRLDRLSRSVLHLVPLGAELRERGIGPRKVIILIVVGSGLLRTSRHGYCSRSPDSGVSAGPSANDQEEPTTGRTREQLPETHFVVTAHLDAATEDELDLHDWRLEGWPGNTLEADARL